MRTARLRVEDGDRDDGDPTIPDADERCATVGIDDDCDGAADEGTAADAITCTST